MKDISEFLPPPEEPPQNKLENLIPRQHPDLFQIPEEDWQEASQRFAAISPLLQSTSEAEFRERSLRTGLSVRTLRRWRDRYLGSGCDFASLIRVRGDSPGPTIHLDPMAELIIQEVIEDIYLNDSKATPAEVIHEIHGRCRKLGLDNSPSQATIYRRLQGINPGQKMLLREGRSAYEHRFKQLVGRAFQGLCPLDIVEGDHGLLNIILLDESRRHRIGRPYVTIFEDVFSRCCLALVLSMEKPALGELGLATAMAVLPKELYLQRLELDYPWPCFGLITTLLLDNALEFQSVQYQRSLEFYNIDVQYRMAGKPETGPHVERLIQTIKREIERLPGTTFQNPTKKGEYDSVTRAELTLTDLEKYLLSWILGTYHQRPHSGLDGKTPLEKWEEGIDGTADSPGLGDPPLPKDPKRFYLDFLPYTQRRILRNGIRIHNIWYQSDELQTLLGASIQSPNLMAGKVLVRYDPSDLSRVYVVHPVTDVYLVVPYRDSSRPPLTLRELNTIRKECRARFNQPSVEEHLFRERERLKTLAAAASTKTKQARVLHARDRRLLNLKPQHTQPIETPVTPLVIDPEPERIAPSDAPLSPDTQEPSDALPPPLEPTLPWPEDVDTSEMD